jgi:hypothetical protein
MWLSKMTRTGLLFPEESRPANEGFAGFGGGESEMGMSRRGSESSVESARSFTGYSSHGSTASEGGDGGGKVVSGTLGMRDYVNRPVLNVSGEERRRKLNPALMVLTHPELEGWHRDAIRKAVGEYGIGVIFVPLFKIDGEQEEQEEEEEEEDDDDLPVLKPLDPKTIRGFTSFDESRTTAEGEDAGQKVKYGEGKEGNLEEEMVLEVDVGGTVEEIIDEVVSGARDVMGASK